MLKHPASMCLGLGLCQKVSLFIF